jgi:Tol biopolymer transport system component
MNKYLLSLTACALALSANAQQGKTLTEKDYERAESFLSYNTEPFIDNGSVRPNWLANDQFSYTVRTATGMQTYLVDPIKKTKTLGSGNQNGNTTARRNAGGPNEVVSPDGKKAVFIKDFNLWVKDLASGKEIQLTTDGVKDYGYATDNAGWTHSDAPIVRWSPDSKKLTTFQQDQRDVKDMYLVTTNVGAPKLTAWKYPLPGDKEIATIRRVIIEIEKPKVISLNIAPDQHRGTLSDDIASSGTFDDIDWKADGSEMAFVSTSRDHKNEKFRFANASTGAVR